MYHRFMLRKELVAASAEPLILALLAKGESYGYAIIEEILARSDRQIEWTEGMLYPVLHRLERKGVIQSRWGESDSGRKRRYYSINHEGKRALQHHHQQWALVHGVLLGLGKDNHV
jgi:PadR family transcriptional regulator, regulatory protein PadR